MERKNVGPGGFPFPLIEGPEESRYLTWVRNHSNYMAERGFLDYMRIVAVVVRGVLVNFLTLLPFLMIGALLIGLFYNPMLDDWDRQIAKSEAAAKAGADAVEAGGEAPEVPGRFFLTRRVDPGARPTGDVFLTIGSWVWSVQAKAGTTPPFLLTPIVVLLGLGYFCLFPVVTRLFKVISHKQALATGNSSSVKLRDRFERSFGGLVLAALAVALIEVLPLLVHQFHQAKSSDLRGLIAMAAGGGSALAVSGAGKLISVLGDAWKKVAMMLVGLLGLILPLLVVLYVSEYLVYQPAQAEEINWLLLSVMPGVILLGMLAALFLGLKRGAFQRLGWVLRLFLLVVVVLGGLFALAYYEILGGRWFTVLALAFEIWFFCFLAVDVNLTSLHGLYRDRLASAYLVGEDTSGDVDIEEDVNLHEICRYETFSTAPYYLINVAHNLQGSKDIAIRERNSDFFIFSKRYVGSGRTGYCRSESLERVYPQVDLATAMAVSAAAAAPNMGAGTSRAMVALMTLLNVRMGFWIPNPGRLEEERQGGYDFLDVFRDELAEIRIRWKNAYLGKEVRGRCEKEKPTPEHNLIGLGMSGGGIRSATINLGILQAFHRKGVFDHIDYMSTVSGGGYLGSSISTLMRTRTPVHSEIAGQASVEASVEDGLGKVTRVTVRGKKPDDSLVSKYLEVATVSVEKDSVVYKYREEKTEVSKQVKAGKVEKGQSLIASAGPELAGLGGRFKWRVRPAALVREMFSLLDEEHRWVNLSDGGHLENLATIELLRRRCRFIITGDCESDPKLHLGSLAALIRFARIDLGIQIEIDPRKIHLRADRTSEHHFTVGRIRYPKWKGEGDGYEEKQGLLLYLKSSFTGDEEELIQHYRNTHSAFPHETTADQFFDEGQFEAYRALGQHIGEQALEHAPGGGKTFDEWLEEKEGRSVAEFFETWFLELAKHFPRPKKSAAEPPAAPG